MNQIISELCDFIKIVMNFLSISVFTWKVPCPKDIIHNRQLFVNFWKLLWFFKEHSKISFLKVMITRPYFHSLIVWTFFFMILFKKAWSWFENMNQIISTLNDFYRNDNQFPVYSVFHMHKALPRWHHSEQSILCLTLNLKF